MISGSITRVVVIPRSIKKLHGPEQSDCSELALVVFESGSRLAHIGRHCFRRNGLDSLSIPRCVTPIDGSAFSDCALELTVVSGPQGICLIDV
jgi:hypothetical protein